MRYHEYLLKKFEGQIPRSISLPNGFHLVGHVALLQLDSELMPYSEMIGNATLEFNSMILSVAVKTGQTNGVRRVPNYSLVAGISDTVTVHNEAGVLFELDPLRVTFSGGNRAERIRMGSIPLPGELVVDMFACVGQFALHIAARNKVKVTAIEINPEAFSFLRKNINLNHVEDKVESILGDCRNSHPVGEADRVILGYLHDTPEYLYPAIDTLKPLGGFIHLHSAVHVGEAARYRNTINTMCEKRGFLSEIETRRVKSYSPNVDHLVFDIRLSRK
jgi:tRNA wybutosine-synthesizing protein 2